MPRELIKQKPRTILADIHDHAIERFKPFDSFPRISALPLMPPPL